MRLLSSIAILATAAASANAAIFTQDFSTSSVVADYVSANPSSSQFNAISSSGAGTVVSINSGRLRYARTGNAGSFSRTTDFSPVPDSMIYKFDLTVSGNSAAQTTAAVFQVGSAFGTANSTESNANTYARIALNVGATAGEFQIRDITNSTNSATLSGTQTITWVLNNSGGTQSYTSPGGATVNVANDRADVYAGTTLLFDDVAVQTSTQVMTDLKFAFTAGTATVDIDNISITAIPEPATLGLLGLAGLAMGRRRR